MSSLTANRADKSADKGVLEEYYYYYYYYHHHHHLFSFFFWTLFFMRRFSFFIIYSCVSYHWYSTIFSVNTQSTPDDSNPS